MQTVPSGGTAKSQEQDDSARSNGFGNRAHLRRDGLAALGGLDRELRLEPDADPLLDLRFCRQELDALVNSLAVRVVDDLDACSLALLGSVADAADLFLVARV